MARIVVWMLLLLSLAGCATRMEHEVRLTGKTLLVTGNISKEMADEFSAIVASHDVARVLIASGGGHVEPAIRMASLIHARGLDVEVGGLCFSSCANYIFPAGKNKSITALGIVGWHGNMRHLMYLHQTGAKTMTGAWLEEVTRLVALEDAFYAAIGVDEFVCWVGKLAPYNVYNTYLLGVDDMARFGIRDVSVRPDYALTDLSGHNTKGVDRVRFIRLEQDLTGRPTIPMDAVPVKAPGNEGHP